MDEYISQILSLDVSSKRYNAKTIGKHFDKTNNKLLFFKSDTYSLSKYIILLI